MKHRPISILMMIVIDLRTQTGSLLVYLITPRQAVKTFCTTYVVADASLLNYHSSIAVLG